MINKTLMEYHERERLKRDAARLMKSGRLGERVAGLVMIMLAHHAAQGGRVDLRTYAKAYAAANPTRHLNPTAFDVMAEMIGPEISENLPKGYSQWREVAEQ